MLHRDEKLTQRRLVVSNKMLNNYHYYALWSLVFAVFYFGAGLAFFMPYEQWNFTEATYFLVQTITTVGYGDVTPNSNFSRVMTCLFAAVGVAAVAGIFSELAYQIFCVHRDRALMEAFSKDDGAVAGPGISHRLGALHRLGKREWMLDGDKSNPVTALLDRQITIKYWASAWMVLEILALIMAGVILIHTVEPWDFVVCVYWAVSTCFTIGYGAPAPTSVIGRWLAVGYMASACFIFMNVVANLASLPAMFHRRTADAIVLAQFDPTVDPQFEEALEQSSDPRKEMEALAARLRQSHMKFTGDDGLENMEDSHQEEVSCNVEEERSYGTQDGSGSYTTSSRRDGETYNEGLASLSPLLKTIPEESSVRRCVGQKSVNGDIVEIFGNAMVSASEDNLTFLREICASKSTVTQDEFSLWLLFLLGRIDATDVQVVRETYEKFKARRVDSSHAAMSFTDIAAATYR